MIAPFLRPADGIGDTPPIPYYMCVQFASNFAYVGVLKCPI